MSHELSMRVIDQRKVDFIIKMVGKSFSLYINPGVWILNK